MPDVKIDYPATEQVTLGSHDTDGTDFFVDCTRISVVVPASEVDAWLAAYDSSNDYSPSAADSRIIARAVLDALKRASGG
jgi:hypothetical protein